MIAAPISKPEGFRLFGETLNRVMFLLHREPFEAGVSGLIPYDLAAEPGISKH